MRRTSAVFGGLGLIGTLGLAGWAIQLYSHKASEPPAARQALGLVTSLPIYWAEASSIEEMLTTKQQPHWARLQFEQDYSLVPLDALSAPDGSGKPSAELAGLRYLLLAQPAAFPPADLVALDTWVRAGGKALIFADPMLTGHSAFGLGDKRRPQDVVTLDPLLARWGLTLVYDPDQSLEPQRLVLGEPVGRAITVELAGRLVPLEGNPAAAECVIDSTALLASCAIGRGRVVILADAAILEEGHGDDPSSRNEALAALLNAGFES